MSGGIPTPFEAKSRLLNSFSARFVPANVIVAATAELRTNMPVPASHPAASVEEFVHVPEANHVSEPKSMADAADEMLTLPVMVTPPDILVRSPPDIVRTPLTVNICVPFASVPLDMVNVDAVNWLSCVRVPPETSSVAND